MLDTVACERARVARDARFDGRFYIGVLTTGVYCRPICPVRPSRPENVRFFPSAAAAADAGFRPCLRCRPESSPGSPASRGTAVTVTRALRLIDEGALDRDGIQALAHQLGVGPRHLGRLFTTHLGASPIQVAQTRRLHLAVKLLSETNLSMTEIAYAAGFGSVRRFNEVVRSVYGRPPRALSRRRTNSPEKVLSLELAYRPPLDWKALCSFLASHAVAGIERVEGLRYRRTIALDGRHGWFEIAPVRGAHKLRVTIDFPDVSALATIVSRVRGMFDLDADPLTIRRHLATDELLARRVAAAAGLRVPGAWDGFELAVCTVLEQQLGVPMGRAVAGRLVERFGKALNGGTRGGSPSRVFPGPKALADADLRRLGASNPEAAAIRALARGIVEGSTPLASACDLDAFVASLAALPAIGLSNAQLIAMRAGYPDAFPHDDLALRRGYAACLDGHGSRLKPQALIGRAERWRPWRAYAVLHLWHADAERRARARRVGARRG